MGLLDFLTGNNSNGSNTSGNGMTGAFGLDPATAQQIQRQQAVNGLLGFLSAAGQASGPSRLPVPLGMVMGAGTQGMLNSQSSTNDQAAKMAQTADTMSQTALRRIQGNASLIGLQNQQQMLKALQQYYTNGTGGNTPSPLVANPTVPTTGASTVSAPPVGTGNISDPRGMIPVITASAQKYGIDPATAI